MSEHENCHVDPVEKPLNENALAQAEAIYLGVSGIGCPTCAMRVRNGLLNLKGVLYADIPLQTAIATVAYDPATGDNRRFNNGRLRIWQRRPS